MTRRSQGVGTTALRSALWSSLRVARLRTSWLAVPVVAAGLLAGCGGTTSGTSAGSGSRVELYGSLAELAGASDAVVTGTVGDQRTVADIPGSDLPFVLSDVTVDGVLSGHLSPGAVVVVRETSGVEELEPGDAYLLYLVASGLPGSAAAQFYVTGATAGVYERSSADAYERADEDSGDTLPATTEVDGALG